jgi:chromosomal replication initiation ATPase DnaA
MGRRQELVGRAKRQLRQEGERVSRSRYDNRILGTEAFVEKFLTEEESIIQERVLLKRKRIDVDELMNVIGKQFGVAREEMLGGSQRRVVGRARSVFCYVGSRKLGLTGIELSQALGLTPAAIHYAVVRGENLVREDKEMDEGMSKYLNNLTTSP